MDFPPPSFPSIRFPPPLFAFGGYLSLFSLVFPRPPRLTPLVLQSSKPQISGFFPFFFSGRCFFFFCSPLSHAQRLFLRLLFFLFGRPGLHTFFFWTAVQDSFFLGLLATPRFHPAPLVKLGGFLPTLFVFGCSAVPLLIYGGSFLLCRFFSGPNDLLPFRQFLL